MKKLLVIAVAFATLVSSCDSGTAGGGSTAIKNGNDSLSNAIGLTMGAQIKELMGGDKLNSAVLIAAFDKAMNAKELSEMQSELQAADGYIRNYVSVVIPAKKKKAGTDYLMKEENKANVLKTDSGLLYEIKEAGEMNMKATATDTVVVHYKGTLIDGTEFDSSYKRNEPATFPLNRVIKGWTEGIQLVGKGGKIRLVIPSELAYGSQGRLANEVLIFDVEVIDVKKVKK